MLKRLPFPAASLGSGPRALTGLLITRSVAANAPAGALGSDRGGSAASLTRPAFPRVARGAPEAERGLGGAAAGQRR